MLNILADTKDMDYLQWLEMRRVGIGGSEVGAICGLSKYKSAYSIYLSKLNELPEEQQSDSAHFGNVLEDIVAKEFTRVTGKKVRRLNKMLRHKEHSFMIADLDRVVVGEKAFLECKTCSAYLSKEWEGDLIPETYMLQIQHYMSVTGYDYCYIACLVGGNKFVWKQINRDDELINTIIEIEKDFWENHVLKRIPPVVVGGEADKHLLTLLYPEDNGTEIALPSLANEKINELLLLKSKKDEIENSISNIENYLKNELGEHEIGTIGNIRVTWKTVNSKRIDSKLLLNKYPSVYEECSKSNSYRKFSIKLPKEMEEI